MSKQVIHTKQAPQAIGPYAQATEFNGIIYTSGQIAINPQTNQLELGSIATETKQVMNNLQEVLKAANANWGSVLKTTIFLKDMNDFNAVNTVYATYFANNNYPARETVQVAKLPNNANVEISMLAHTVNTDNAPA